MIHNIDECEGCHGAVKNRRVFMKRNDNVQWLCEGCAGTFASKELNDLFKKAYFDGFARGVAIDGRRDCMLGTVRYNFICNDGEDLAESLGYNAGFADGSVKAINRYDELECPVCLSDLTEIVRHGLVRYYCGHIVCMSCYSLSLLSSCPMCRNNGEVSYVLFDSGKRLEKSD